MASLLLETNIRLERMMYELVWAPCALQIGWAWLVLLPIRNSDITEVDAFTCICCSLQALSWYRSILVLWVRRLRDRGEPSCPSAHTPKAGRIRMPIQAAEHMLRTLQTPLLSHVCVHSLLFQSSTSLLVFLPTCRCRQCVCHVGDSTPSAQHRASLGPSLHAPARDSKTHT